LTKYRAYYPAIGRWLSRDPIDLRGGVNLCEYVFNQPTIYSDRLGKRWHIPILENPPDDDGDDDHGDDRPGIPFGSIFSSLLGDIANAIQGLDDMIDRGFGHRPCPCAVPTPDPNEPAPTPTETPDPHSPPPQQLAPWLPPIGP
jgi:hypothetical protein